MSAKAVILENDEIDPKGLVDRLFKDGEYLGVYVTDKEDCRCLTDRWGDVDPDLPPLTAAEAEAVARLKRLLVDEITFVAVRQGVIGLLFEWEYLDPTSTDHDALEIEDAWMRTHGRVPSHGEAVEAIVARAKEIGQRCPDAQVYVSVGAHNALGIALRAFLANPTEAKVKALSGLPL